VGSYVFNFYLFKSKAVRTMGKVYKNTYTPPKVVIDDLHSETPEDEYDHNFVFEVKDLRSDRVELRPFIVSYSDHPTTQAYLKPSLHSQLLLQGHLEAPEISYWLPMSFKTVDDVHRFVETAFRTVPVSLPISVYASLASEELTLRAIASTLFTVVQSDPSPVMSPRRITFLQELWV
jgi:hypothetical protein